MPSLRTAETLGFEAAQMTGKIRPINPGGSMRVAIYARVSKRDDSQDATNQLDQLRAWCAAVGHTVVAEFIDKDSGGKSAEQRKQLGSLLERAHRREFDVVLFWAIDRLSREGMRATIGYLQRLADCGVAFHSFTEPALCSDNELVRDIVLAVMSSLAKAERVRMSQRTIAGLERVRRNGSKSGKAIGRPSLDPSLVARIAEMVRDNPTICAFAVSKAIGCDPKTARKYLTNHQQSDAGTVDHASNLTDSTIVTLA